MAIYRGSESTGTATQVFNIDGDKGDITVTNGGDTWTIDAGVVTTTKLGGDITPQGKALLDDATAAAQRTTLGLGSAAVTEASAYATATQGVKADSAVQPVDIVNMVETSDIGVSVQAYSANLAEYATVNPTVAGLALLDDIDAAAQRATLGLGTLATQSGTISGINTGDQNLFSTIAVAGQSSVVADATSDTLTIVAGDNVSIITDAATDTITINSAGASGVPDGDKGDITVSSGGTVWAIDAGAVTPAKLSTGAPTWNTTGNVGIGTTATTGNRVNVSSTQSSTTATEFNIYNSVNANNVSGAVPKIGIFSNVQTVTGYAGTGSLISNYAQVSHTTTGTVGGFVANLGIIANTSTGTISNAANYQANAATNSGGGTISQQIGYICNDLTTATVNYAFYSNVSSGANKWNFYSAGTANNYFAGNVGIGTGKTVPTTALDVNGTVTATGWAGGGIVTETATQGLSNKTVNLTNNTLTGTKAQFDTACSDSNFVYTDAIGVSVQAYNANLTTYATTAPTVAGLALLDDVDTAAQRTTLGLGAISTQGDGDKGDITVSASGATWTIDNDAVTFAKIQNITTSRLLGRATAGSGDAEEITLGSGVKFSSGALTSLIPFRLRNLTTGTTYTPPADVVSFLACVYGAVGGRTGVQNGGRGGNGYSEKYYATPSGSYTYSIGAAGTTAGTAGGTTTFGVMSVTGSGGVTTTTGSAGGVGSGGDFNATGGTGGNGDGTRGGGGGGAASRAGNGGNGANQTGSTGGGGGGTGGNNASGATGGAAATVKAAGAYALPSNFFVGEYFDSGTTTTTAAGASGSNGTSTFLGAFVIQLGSSGIDSGTTSGTTAAGETGYITIVEFLQ